MAKNNEVPKDQNIIPLPFEEAMPDNYLPYAVDVAKDRALPDIRDGLKPVHRRILYGSYLLKAYPDRPYFKSARIVGDILGKFHPHGDSSVYDAMVILAQDFSTREPLMDGHGNWGSIDGDSAAAMRYTEARLSKQAMLMLKDIDMDTVDFQNNYSDTEVEPVVLPAKFPNLLVNGTFGIAVGLATNIPPHNLGEVIDATCALIKKPKMDTEDLMEYIKGPDLPTGGIVIGRDALKSAYTTGEGKVTLRAKTEIEKLPNGRLGIVITEFPYRKNKARLLQTISEMTGDKKHQKVLEAISDIRDESDREGIRAVVELKKSTTEKQADLILKYLFKKTDLQSNLSFNMVAINNGKPGTFSLKEIIEAYIMHQREVIRRRTEKELDNAKKRFHIVEGFIKAIDVLDEVIKIIRASKNKADSIKNLVETFSFTELQATAIVELMLYRLTGLELEVFLEEHRKLTATIERLTKILSSEAELNKVIIKELTDIKKEFDNPRRTLLIDDMEEAAIDTSELIVVEDSMVTLSREGFIKKVPLKTYNRTTADVSSVELREGDDIACVFKTNTLDNILVFTNKGNMYQFKSDKIPEMKWKDKGVRFDEFFRGSNLSDDEVVVSAFSFKELTETMIFKFITDKGGIKKTASYSFNTNYTRIVAIKLKADEELFACIVEDNRKLIDNKIPSLINEKEEDNRLIELNSLYGEENPVLSENFMGEEEDSVLDENLSINDWNEIPSCVSITTKQGLSFTVSEDDIEIKDKMITPDKLSYIPENDKIVSLSYDYDMEIKSFYLALDKKGNISPFDKKSKTSSTRFEGNSNSEIVVVTSSGIAYKMPGYIFENITSSISLSDILGLGKKESIINVFTREASLVCDDQLIVATSNGFIKRMAASELDGNSEKIQLVKFKGEGDSLVYAEYRPHEIKGELLLITAKGMALKFMAESVSVLSKVAAGITGISLKEDDLLISAKLVEGIKEVSMKTDKKSHREINPDEIKTSARARKGINIFRMVLDELINEVNYK